MSGSGGGHGRARHIRWTGRIWSALRFVLRPRPGGRDYAIRSSRVRSGEIRDRSTGCRSGSSGGTTAVCTGPSSGAHSCSTALHRGASLEPQWTLPSGRVQFLLAASRSGLLAPRLPTLLADDGSCGCYSHHEFRCVSRARASVVARLHREGEPWLRPRGRARANSLFCLLLTDTRIISIRVLFRLEDFERFAGFRYYDALLYGAMSLYTYYSYIAPLPRAHIGAYTII